MVRFPYTLEMWYEEDATQNPDGSWTEGTHEWRVVGKCNIHKMGEATVMKGLNGESTEGSYQVLLPPRIEPIVRGTKIRIFRNGINFFNGKPHDNRTPKEDPMGYGTCKDFDPFRQKYEDKVLWL